MRLDLERLHGNDCSRGGGKTTRMIAELMGNMEYIDECKLHVVFVPKLHYATWLLPMMIDVATGMGFSVDTFSRARRKVTFTNGAIVRVSTLEFMRDFDGHKYRAFFDDVNSGQHIANVHTNLAAPMQRLCDAAIASKIALTKMVNSMPGGGIALPGGPVIGVEGNEPVDFRAGDRFLIRFKDARKIEARAVILPVPCDCCGSLSYSLTNHGVPDAERPGRAKVVSLCGACSNALIGERQHEINKDNGKSI